MPTDKLPQTISNWINTQGMENTKQKDYSWVFALICLFLIVITSIFLFFGWKI